MSTIIESLRQTRDASRLLVCLPDVAISNALLSLADALLLHTEEILAANKKDLGRMDSSDPKYDRLLLTPHRIAAMAADVRIVAALPSPLGCVLEERTLPNGLHLEKISVPIGVIGMIYESRPNVTVDAFSLCFKAGNACVLKGGSDAGYSNVALMKIIHAVLRSSGIDEHVVTLLPTDREAVTELLQADAFVDVIIPRGSKQLIDFVRDNARVPVIETGAGIVHTYIDESADIAKATAIILNEKIRRPSVCNALDTIVLHSSLLSKLPDLVKGLAKHNVEIFADSQAYDALEGSYPKELLSPASEEHFGTEFLSLKCSIKTVHTIDEALEHIARYSSRHSEAIIAQNPEVIERFLNEVDAAVVYANAATTFSDGAQFGMGGEIGISTQKLHARGPMGLKEITSYKWVVRGNGQVRAA